MRRRWTVTGIAILTLAAGVAGAAAPAGEQAAGSDAATSQPAGQVMEFEHLRVDLAERQIEMDSEVVLREGWLELLVCPWQTKTHESILHTKAKPWQVHAGLLAMGLTPGKPAEWIYREDTDETLAIPPRGARLSLRVRWSDEQGTMHEVPASDWLTGGDDGNRQPPEDWIFVGSEMLPDGGYAADADDTLICVSNFATAVIDVPFESSDKQGQWEFQAKTDAIPPMGTPVTVIIAPRKGAEKSPYARSYVTIDANGELAWDGQELPREQLEQRAGEFISRHRRGRVVVQVRARALVHDVEWVLDQLMLGGVRDTVVQRIPAAEVVLPRTERQLQADLAQWAQKLAEPEEYLQDPAQQAGEALKQVDRRLREIERRRELWKEYARQLRKMRQQEETGEAR